ncbi:hypothetical protein BY996DRAFT_6408722 [Phakopsora pachyrhizi]|uniref:Expressed protein n=1 Tax=Phakopsora pachyrhizi TaxID=170000 RepID=A0AAV0ALP9_PHAPC|nr:hypothetical protein BY996DRAFT_6408722 [Phakopsora pachyrhizi]CAH7669689.1 expressed protein [Phakopsora pachyrhizi]
MLSRHNLGFHNFGLGRTPYLSRSLHLTNQLRNRDGDRHQNSNQIFQKPHLTHNQSQRNPNTGPYASQPQPLGSNPSNRQTWGQRFPSPQRNLFPPPRRLLDREAGNFPLQFTEGSRNSPNVSYNQSNHLQGGYRDFRPPALISGAPPPPPPRLPVQRFWKHPAGSQTNYPTHMNSLNAPPAFSGPTNFTQNQIHFPRPGTPPFPFPQNQGPLSQKMNGQFVISHRPNENKAGVNLTAPTSSTQDSIAADNWNRKSSLSGRKNSGITGAFEFDLQDITGVNVVNRFSENNQQQNLLHGTHPGPTNLQPKNYYPPRFQNTNPHSNALGFQRGNWTTGNSFRAPLYQQPNSNGGFDRSIMPNSRGGPFQKPRSSPKLNRRRGGLPGSLGWKNRLDLRNNRFIEPSLPPPPKTVLNEKGEFGNGPITSGCSSDIAYLNFEKSVSLKALTSDYSKVRNLLQHSADPISIPGFPKPMKALLGDGKSLIDSNLEVCFKAGEAKRGEIVGQGINLLLQNPSIDIQKKLQAAAVVDFMLMSREERSSAMA